nr:MAG TPA: hypothetical protein [Caudoviricetes sp.]
MLFSSILSVLRAGENSSQFLSIKKMPLPHD